MTEIQEGNKLIAEFMGWTYSKSSDAGILGGSITYWRNPETGHVGYFHPDKYHSSWDWLMPVVEKINTMFGEKSRELSNHSRDQEHLENPLGNPLCWKSWSYHWIHLSTDINYVFKKVVKAIKWYNENK